MKLAIFALTEGGAKTALQLAEGLNTTRLGSERIGRDGERVEESAVFLPLELGEKLGFGSPYRSSTSEAVRAAFREFDGIVCIMAAGIVVRSIAPVLKGKATDPAVVVVDERGRFAVSLVSGHLGGANDLARSVAKVLGGTPVITTSTDVQEILAADVLARDLGVRIEDVSLVKGVNAALARGERIVLLTEYALPLPESHPIWHDRHWEIRMSDNPWQDAIELEVAGTTPVLLTSRLGQREYLCLRPPVILAGVGCRKGVPGERILAGLKAACSEAGRSILSLKKIASISEKAGEAGILQAAADLRVDTEFYPAEALQVIVEAQGLAQSDFVNKQMGVGGVCEPASLAACRQGKLVLGKQAKSGVTVALAEEKFGW